MFTATYSVLDDVAILQPPRPSSASPHISLTRVTNIFHCLSNGVEIVEVEEK